jgi:hypothetical protein
MLFINWIDTLREGGRNENYRLVKLQTFSFFNLIHGIIKDNNKKKLKFVTFFSIILKKMIRD